MFNITKKEMTWAGKKLTLETGRMARQADGAVLVTYGESTVLVTAVAKREARPGQDFFPLSVHYQEKYFAAGKIPGGFFKREGRPTERDTLTSRLIDRPIRPLFPKGFLNETQVIATVVSFDLQHETDIPALIGASAALTISGIPFMGPVGAARVGYIDEEFVLNPTTDQMKNSKLDLVVAGTKEGVLMVESEAHELSEEIMLDAVMFGWKGFQPIIDMIIEMAEKCAKEPWDIQPLPYDKEALETKVRDLVSNDFKAAYLIREKVERVSKLSAAKAKAVESCVPKDDKSSLITSAVIEAMCKEIEADIVRNEILDKGIRILSLTNSLDAIGFLKCLKKPMKLSTLNTDLTKFKK